MSSSDMGSDFSLLVSKKLACKCEPFGETKQTLPQSAAHGLHRQLVSHTDNIFL